MLPEKKKNLLIVLGIVIGVIAITIIVALISKAIKKNAGEKIIRNDNYATNYEYYGILKDSDDIYRIYGINSKDEDYLSVRTFYDVKGAKVLSDRIIFYSDVLNELRYDSKEKEYYLYELNNFYNNKYEVNVADNYLVIKQDKILSYFKFDQGIYSKTDITNNLEYENILVNNNLVYYLKENNIMEYDLDQSLEKEISYVDNPQNTTLIAKEGKYLYYYDDNDLVVYDTAIKIIINIKEYLDSYKFIGTLEDGFLYLSDNGELRKFNNTYKSDEGKFLELDGVVTTSKKIKDDIYLMKVNNKNMIVNVKDKNIIRTLEQDYLYILKVD